MNSATLGRSKAPNVRYGNAIRPQNRTRLTRVACFASAPAPVQGAQRTTDHHQLSRRALSLSLGAAAVASLLSFPSSASSASIELVADSEGFGKKVARRGDLVLFHYVGTLSDGTVFDSTRGGLFYRDGGDGVFRPTAIRLGGSPVPGICEGLLQGLQGMRIGGKRTIVVPPELGFGGAGVLAPYAYVPPNSTVKYEVELLRLSTLGPDELTKGISRCGTGGDGATAENCRLIEYLEV